MKQTILTAKQSSLLENLIVKYGQIVTAEEIYKEAAEYWDYKQAKNLVTLLTKNGWLMRIKRGLYAISDLSSRGTLSLSPYVAANLLAQHSYVSFESALQQYGMFDQLTKKTISVSLTQHKSVELAGIEYNFVKTKPKYFFGWHDAAIGSLIARIATPEKAIIDMVNFHKSQYAIDLVIEKLSDFKSGLNFDIFSDYLIKFPVTTQKIFGFIFDLLRVDSQKLYVSVKPAGTHWMLPGDNKFNAKWRLYYQADFDKYKSK